MSVRASVVVCTHNRSAPLVRTVESLLPREVEDDSYEVIVVDNAGTDSTPDVIRELQRQQPDGRLRYVREERLGLHYARHTGDGAAAGRLPLHTDDDVEVAPT